MFFDFARNRSSRPASDPKAKSRRRLPALDALETRTALSVTGVGLAAQAPSGRPLQGDVNVVGYVADNSIAPFGNAYSNLANSGLAVNYEIVDASGNALKAGPVQLRPGRNGVAQFAIPVSTAQLLPLADPTNGTGLTVAVSAQDNQDIANNTGFTAFTAIPQIAPLGGLGFGTGYARGLGYGYLHGNKQTNFEVSETNALVDGSTFGHFRFGQNGVNLNGHGAYDVTANNNAASDHITGNGRLTLNRGNFGGVGLNANGRYLTATSQSAFGSLTATGNGSVQTSYPTPVDASAKLNGRFWLSGQTPLSTISGYDRGTLWTTSNAVGVTTLKSRGTLFVTNTASLPQQVR